MKDINYKIGEILETDPEHSDMVDANLYSMVAIKTVELIDRYVLLHIQKPRWCPVWLYHFFIKHFVNITNFKK